MGTHTFGIRPPGRVYLDTTFEEVVDWVVEAEQRGFDSVHFGDRLLAKAPPAYNSTWYEVTTTLAQLAAETETIRLGPLVYVMPFRHPILTAKIFGTLDVVSNGRVIMGVGTGWNPHEFKSLDTPKRERGRRLEEGVEVLKHLWTSDHVDYPGEIYDFEDVTIEPKPVQDPHPPVWFGSFGPTVEDFTPLVSRVLERIGRLGDGWVPVTYSTVTKEMISPTKLAKAWSEIETAARNYGRNPDDIEIVFSHHTYVFEDEVAERDDCMELVEGWFDATYEEAKETYLIGTPDEVVERIEQLTAELPRVDRYIFTPMDVDEHQLNRIADEVVPQLSG